MTLYTTVPTIRPLYHWQDLVKTEEGYNKVFKSGMAYVWFPNWPTMQEFKEYLKNKEKQ